MAVDVTAETVIQRPREEVADYATRPENDPTWIAAISDVRVLTDGPFRTGTQVARIASFLGRRLEYVNEVADYQPGSRLLMRSVKAPFPMTVAYEFEDAREARLSGFAPRATQRASTGSPAPRYPAR